MRQLISLSLSIALALSALAAVPASAGVERETSRDVSLTVDYLCEEHESKWVQLDGRIFGHWREETDGSGGLHVLYKSLGQYKGIGLEMVNGTVVPTGEEWLAKHMWKWSGHIGADELPFSGTYVDNTKMAGKGQASDLHIRWRYHITINANGDLSVERDSVTALCDGIPFDPEDDD